MEDGRGLSLRELVLEVRADVKSLRLEMERDLVRMDARVSTLESSNIALRGAWATLGILAATVSGVVGLTLGVYAAL